MARKSMIAIGLLLVVTPLFGGCCTIAGTAVGGVAGAGIGGAIGLVGGRPTEGAATGAKAGCVGGACVGAVCDAVILSPIWVPALMLHSPEDEGLTVDDVIAMKERGVAEEVIIGQIEWNGMRKPLATNDVIRLAENDIGNRVVLAMQENGSPNEPVTMPVQNVPVTTHAGDVVWSPQEVRKEDFRAPSVPMMGPSPAPYPPMRDAGRVNAYPASAARPGVPAMQR